MMWELCSHTFCQIKAFSIIAFLQMRKFVPAPHCDHSFYVTWHLLCHRIHDKCDYSPKKWKWSVYEISDEEKKIRARNEIGNCSGLTALLAHSHYYCCYQHQGRIKCGLYCGKNKDNSSSMPCSFHEHLPLWEMKCKKIIQLLRRIDQYGWAKTENIVLKELWNMNTRTGVSRCKPLERRGHCVG